MRAFAAPEACHAPDGASAGTSEALDSSRFSYAESQLTEEELNSPDDTFPKLLLRNAEIRPGKIAYREKEFGIWQSWTWLQVHDEVKRLAYGLKTLGFERGDRLAIIGSNRPRLYMAIAAAQSLGGEPVPVYADSVATEMAYVLEHSEAKFAVVEDQEQVDKLLDVAAEVPSIQQIIYCDPRGLRDYDDDKLSSFDELQIAGDELQAQRPELFRAELQRGHHEDAAIILYTSGTTGKPKGVVLTFSNLLWAARESVKFDGLTEEDEILAYLPMAWIGEHIFSYCQAYVAGFTVNCPESAETVFHDLREIGPTYFFAPPRIFEQALTSIMVRMEDAGRLKRWLFNRALKIGREIGPRLVDGEDVSAIDRLRYAITQATIFAPLRNVRGFTNLRVGYTAGEAIGPEIFDFFRAMGINMKQLYGATEASVYVTNQRDGAIRANTVGPPFPGVEIQIDDAGEIHYRSPGVFREYFKMPDKTAEDKTSDGWVKSGDAGFFDAEGHLRIIDRAKDVGKMADGQMFPPKYIENALKFFPNIKEVVAHGDGRDEVTAFINIDLEAVGNWAERNNIAYTGYVDLCQNADVARQISENVAEVNRQFSEDPQMQHLQIRRFLLLPKLLDADDGELTRTSKVRRAVINERYGELIAALYDGSDNVAFSAQVNLEDGTSYRVESEVAILSAETVAYSRAGEVA